LGAERGYENLSPAAVAATAGLPEAVFHEHFTSIQQCLGAAYDSFVARVMTETASAMGEDDDWPVQVRSAVAAGLAFVNETATRSRFFAVDALAAGPLILERYSASMAGIVGIMRAGREERPEAADLPDLLEPILIGGMASLVTGALLVEEHEHLPAMETELVEILLTPYLGRDEARRVAG
jgi:AcrR family transcriptional regulator